MRNCPKVMYCGSQHDIMCSTTKSRLSNSLVKYCKRDYWSFRNQPSNARYSILHLEGRGALLISLIDRMTCGHSATAQTRLCNGITCRQTWNAITKNLEICLHRGWSWSNHCNLTFDGRIPGEQRRVLVVVLSWKHIDYKPRSKNIDIKTSHWKRSNDAARNTFCIG